MLSAEDVKNILYILHQSESAHATLLSGKAIDFAYQINNPETGENYRFRVNAISIYSRGVNGIHITLRTISSIPKKASELEVDQEIMDNYIRDEGMVIFTGSTGTGKTTLMAALIRDILENNKVSKKILTYEAPIEFIYENIPSERSMAVQTEVYKQVPSFKDGIVSALRRSPDIIIIGESRDTETIEQSILASQSGHLLITTSHTNGVSETIKRMVNEFSKDERNARALDLIAAMNIIISQKLVSKVGGGRIALREYLVFTDDIKKKLQTCDVDNLSYHTRLLLKEYGQTFYMDAMKKYKEGKIGDDVLERLKFSDKAIDEDNEKNLRK